MEGQLELAGAGEHRIRTSNGSISLRMPHSTQGLLWAVTSNGRVEVLLGEHRIAGQKEVVLHSGAGPRLELTTGNGSITVLGY